jgi:hypothetical protein
MNLYCFAFEVFMTALYNPFYFIFYEARLSVLLCHVIMSSHPRGYRVITPHLKGEFLCYMLTVVRIGTNMQ